jgi:anthranilate/para-aminobenzoate synthase component II
MELTFHEVSMFDGIVRYSKSMKLHSLWMKFNSVTQSLEVADKREKPTIRWQLKVQKIATNSLNFHH